ncbi:hypothetical protein VTJ49DRAFT_956 [Mycothermus thermophilus]|uniref:Uncharacterized protein n=1 Tax=Humicola insolens TaxID=85995 RepID=A0ABR3VDQ0_HUMIN
MRSGPFRFPCGSMTAAVVLLLASTIHLVAAQAIDPDRIDFSTMEIWKDLKDCVKCMVDICGGVKAVRHLTPSSTLPMTLTLGNALPRLHSSVLSYCSNRDDASTATSVLTAYCAAKGYTEIVAPTIPATTGAYVTVTETVTRFLYTGQVSAANIVAPAGAAMTRVAALFGVGAIIFVVPFAWLSYTQTLRRASGR